MFPFAEEQAALCRDRLVIRSVKPMENKKRKKWNGYLAAGLFMTGLVVFLGILGYFWTPYSTTAMSAAEKFTAPSMHHIFGTDNFGRDIFSRVMQGLGTTLVISTSVVLFSTVAGVLLGAFTGYFGDILDEILMRITDAVNGFPSILLTLVIISLLGKGRQNVIIALGIVFIPSFVRIVRGEFLRLRDADYIKRARLMGVSRLRILFVHILPNIFSVLLVSVMIGFNNAILAESGMSYLGIGVQAPGCQSWHDAVRCTGIFADSTLVCAFPGTCDRLGGAWIFTAGRRYPEMGREQGRVEAVW